MKQNISFLYTYVRVCGGGGAACGACGACVLWCVWYILLFTFTCAHLLTTKEASKYQLSWFLLLPHRVTMTKKEIVNYRYISGLSVWQLGTKS